MVKKLEQVALLGLYGGALVVLGGVIVGTVAAAPLLLAGHAILVGAEALDERLSAMAVKRNRY